jgi:hypothetical protein
MHNDEDSLHVSLARFASYASHPRLPHTSSYPPLPFPPLPFPPCPRPYLSDDDLFFPCITISHA